MSLGTEMVAKVTKAFTQERSHTGHDAERADPQKEDPDGYTHG